MQIECSEGEVLKLAGVGREAEKEVGEGVEQESIVWGASLQSMGFAAVALRVRHQQPPRRPEASKVHYETRGVASVSGGWLPGLRSRSCELEKHFREPTNGDGVKQPGTS
jgi:hypothetical protein